MKSHLSDCLEVWQVIYLDAVASCAADVSLRDIRTTMSRAEEEGMSFLTITLPNFARDFEKSLELGMVDSTLFRNFRKNGAIPAFLQGMLSRIFDRDTGRINDVKNNDSPIDVARTVSSIRQICLCFKKIELPCTSARTYAALENFVFTEHSFEVFTLSDADIEAFASVSDVLWGDVLRNICMDSVFPRHGPGATSERKSGNQKYSWEYWHDRLEPFLSLSGFGLPYCTWETRFERDELHQVHVLSEEEEIPVRVTPVPKTLKGPRIIAIEPCCMQYAQQGLRHLLYEVIESHGITGGHINFRDQSVNQALALRSSMDQSLATIDLSDASDRVPLDLALSMFDTVPDFRDFVNACRSSRAKMPDGRIIGPLRKFASMGSALCFPVEAMYFYTISVIASLRFHNLPVTLQSIKAVARDLYVYGDDIIVPTGVAATVLAHLEKYNCKVNAAKTFYRGFFRESCGVDGYLGTPVQPVYVGTLLPENRRQSSEFISSVETANLFYKKGYLRTSLLLFDKVEKVFGPLPTVSEESHVIGRNHFFHLSSLFKRRWNEDHQCLEFKLLVPKPVYRTDVLDGFAALQKCLMKLESLSQNEETSEPYRMRSLRPVDKYIDYIDSLVAVDVKHLERSARHGVVATQRRWVPVQNTEYRR